MKLIKIAQDHYVIVDDSEIREGDLVFNEYQRQIKKFHAGSGIGLCRKITHSTQPLDERGYWGKVMPLTLTISEIKELIGEVDVEKKAEKFIGCEYKDIEDNIDQIGYDSFIRGYNQALEDNKDKVYTEEDMIEFAEWCENLQKDNKEIRRSNPSITTKELLQLWKEQQPKIVYYE